MGMTNLSILRVQLHLNFIFVPVVMMTIMMGVILIVTGGDANFDIQTDH